MPHLPRRFCCLCLVLAAGASVLAVQPATDPKAPARPAPAREPSTKFDPRDSVALSQLREQAVQMLVAAAGSTSPEERANACEALLLAPGRLESLLPGLLRDGNLGVRAVAAGAVARGKFTKWIEEVRPLLNDPSPMVRAMAVFAMVRCGADANPTALGRLLQSSEPRVMAQAAFVLGELGNASAMPMLREAAVRGNVRADQSELRLAHLQIAEALVKLGDTDALHELRAALYPSRPEDLETAALAAQILGQVRDKGSMTQLMYLTAQLDPQKRRMPAEVRLAAAGALARLGNANGSFIADEFAGSAQPPLRAQAAFVYGETGKADNLPRLAELMSSDPAPLVRIAAAHAILKIVDARGTLTR